MKYVVVYESKYGTTKKYAEWIAKRLNCDICERKKATKETITNHDFVIYGGGLYAGNIAGIKFIKQNKELLRNKQWALFTTGLTDPSIEENIKMMQKTIKKSIPEELLTNCITYHLRGGIDYKKLTKRHRLMMKMLTIILKRKKSKDLTKEHKLIIDSYGKYIDFTRKDTMLPFVDAIKKATGKKSNAS